MRDSKGSAGDFAQKFRAMGTKKKAYNFFVRKKKKRRRLRPDTSIEKIGGVLADDKISTKNYGQKNEVGKSKSSKYRIRSESGFECSIQNFVEEEKNQDFGIYDERLEFLDKPIFPRSTLDSLEVVAHERSRVPKKEFHLKNLSRMLKIQTKNEILREKLQRENLQRENEDSGEKEQSEEDISPRLSKSMRMARAFKKEEINYGMKKYLNKNIGILGHGNIWKQLELERDMVKHQVFKNWFTRKYHSKN